MPSAWRRARTDFAWRSFINPANSDPFKNFVISKYSKLIAPNKENWKNRGFSKPFMLSLGLRAILRINRGKMMGKLFKKNKPTSATYFTSESQRKKTSRLSFIHGSPQLVAVISVLVLASLTTGLVIVQKQKDSKAAS